MEKQIVSFENKFNETHIRSTLMGSCFEVVSTIDYLSEDQIKDVIKALKPTRWAYILHNKDIYYDKREGIIKPKIPHYHVVLEFSKQVKLTTIADSFCVADNFVELPKGKDPFTDKCVYLTHHGKTQQQLGKVRYSFDSVKTNFDFSQTIKEFVREKSRSPSSWKLLFIPEDNKIYETQKAHLFKMPKTSNYSKYVFWYPSKLVKRTSLNAYGLKHKLNYTFTLQLDNTLENYNEIELPKTVVLMANQIAYELFNNPLEIILNLSDEILP